MPIVTVQEAVEQGMLGQYDTLHGDQNIRSTRSNPLSGAGAATVARNAAAIDAVPDVADLNGGTHILLEACDVYEQTGLPLMLYEAFLLGSIDAATAAFTDGVVAPTRTTGGISREIPLSLWLEMGADMVSARTVQVTYTNQDGVTGQVTTNHATTSNAIKHSGGFMVLATGDTGVLDVTSAAATGGTSPTGTINLWGVNPITILPSLGAATAANLLAEGVVRRVPASAQLRSMVVGGQVGGRTVITDLTYFVDTP